MCSVRVGSVQEWKGSELEYTVCAIFEKSSLANNIHFIYSCLYVCA